MVIKRDPEEWEVGSLFEIGRLIVEESGDWVDVAKITPGYRISELLCESWVRLPQGARILGKTLRIKMLAGTG
jgi:hypothetical protein